jgi:hypothetical protein
MNRVSEAIQKMDVFSVKGLGSAKPMLSQLGKNERCYVGGYTPISLTL